MQNAQGTQEAKRRVARPGRYWIVDQVVAYVEDGIVTLQIDKPTRHLPWEKLISQKWPGETEEREEMVGMAIKAADPLWYAGQSRKLEVARETRQTTEIPLTDRRRRSSLRMGGGFMIVQGTKLVVPRRDIDAPTRPGQYCECAGVFEVLPSDSVNDPEDLRNDYVASLLRETAEIALVRGGTLFVPQLALSWEERTLYQPPIPLNFYNAILEEEALGTAQSANIPFEKIVRMWVKILDYEEVVRLQFAYSPQVSIEIAAETDTSSLECVGVISYPVEPDIELVQLLQALQSKGATGMEDKELEKLRESLREDISIDAKLVERLRKEGINTDEIIRPIEYWDTECLITEQYIKLVSLLQKLQREGNGGMSARELAELGTGVRESISIDELVKRLQETEDITALIAEDKLPKILDREIHLIDYRTGDVEVWYTPANLLGKKTSRRKRRFSKLWDELAATQLGGTQNRYATEKLEKAIKMHCPDNPILQPLITL
jgi:hypothetical protein